MATSALHSEQQTTGKRSRAAAALAVWSALVGLFFFWESVSYTGLTAWAAEWQFAHFEAYFPVLTYLIFVLLFSIPVLIYSIYRWRRDKKTVPAEERSGGKALAASARMMRFLFAIAVGFGVATVIAVFVTATLPQANGSPQRVIAGSAAALSPAEGRTTLVGNRDLTLIAGFGQDMTLIGRQTYIVPVRGTVGDRDTVRYFAEVERLNEAPVRFKMIDEGVLRRNALPGELLALYKNVGLSVGSPHFVLFKSNETMRWRHLSTVCQLALLTLLVLLFGLFQRSRRNRLRKSLLDQMTAS